MLAILHTKRLRKNLKRIFLTSNRTLQTPAEPEGVITPLTRVRPRGIDYWGLVMLVLPPFSVSSRLPICLCSIAPQERTFLSGLDRQIFPVQTGSDRAKTLALDRPIWPRWVGHPMNSLLRERVYLYLLYSFQNYLNRHSVDEFLLLDASQPLLSPFRRHIALRDHQRP